MTSKTLEQYLIAALDSGRIDHQLRANRGLDGKITFYIHPERADGETLDFVVRGNGLALNLTSDSDVHQGIESLMETRIPILDQIRELCWAIEKCGASPELTDAVTKASALFKPITGLVEQALAIGIGAGIVSASCSQPTGQSGETQSLLSKSPSVPAAVPCSGIEQEIQAKGLTAPRITPDDIKANIVSEHYFTAKDGVAHNMDHYPLKGELPESLSLLTFYVLVLRNGFTVTGESACASPENFDAEIGRKIARENAIDKLYPLMGYELRSRLHREAGHGVAGS